MALSCQFWTISGSFGCKMCEMACVPDSGISTYSVDDFGFIGVIGDVSVVEDAWEVGVILRLDPYEDECSIFVAGVPRSTCNMLAGSFSSQ